MNKTVELFSRREKNGGSGHELLVCLQVSVATIASLALFTVYYKVKKSMTSKNDG